MTTPEGSPPQPSPGFDKRGLLFAVISTGSAAVSWINFNLAAVLVPIAVLFCFAGLWRCIRGYRGANLPMAIIATAITAAVVYSSFQEFGGAILNGECVELARKRGEASSC